MPLMLKIVNKVLTLTWRQDLQNRTMEATFRIPPETPDEEIVQTLRTFLKYMEAQMGMPEDPGTTKATASATSATTSGTPAAETPVTRMPHVDAAQTASISDAGRVLMMPPATLSDRPSDGGPAGGSIDWSAMPTNQVPGQLAGNWEMDTDGGSW